MTALLYYGPALVDVTPSRRALTIALSIASPQASRRNPKILRNINNYALNSQPLRHSNLLQEYYVYEKIDTSYLFAPYNNNFI